MPVALPIFRIIEHKLGIRTEAVLLVLVVVVLVLVVLLVVLVVGAAGAHSSSLWTETSNGRNPRLAPTLLSFFFLKHKSAHILFYL